MAFGETTRCEARPANPAAASSGSALAIEAPNRPTFASPRPLRSPLTYPLRSKPQIEFAFSLGWRCNFTTDHQKTQ